MKDRPLLQERLLPVWSAFQAMAGDRNIGMGGAGRIPFTAIDRYAHRYNISDLDDFDRFRRLISAMDDAYVERISRTVAGG